MELQMGFLVQKDQNTLFCFCDIIKGLLVKSISLQVMLVLRGLKADDTTDAMLHIEASGSFNG
jgi:hypothetical protein